MKAILVFLSKYRFIFIAVLAFLAAWVIQGWRLGGEIARLQNEGLQLHVARQQTMINQAQTAMDNISAAATRLTGISDTLDTQFHNIKEDFKNAIHATPLPVDCKPDAGRLRSLTAAVNAANAAFSGQQPEKAVRTADSANRTGL